MKLGKKAGATRTRTRRRHPSNEMGDARAPLCPAHYARGNTMAVTTKNAKKTAKKAAKKATKKAAKKRAA